MQVYAQLSEAWTGAESEVSANLLAFCAFLTNLAVHWERHGIHERNGNSILCGPKQTQIRFTGGRTNPCRIWLQIKSITNLLCFAVTWPESQKQPNKFRSLLPRWRFNLKKKSWNVRVFDCFCTPKSWRQMVNNWHWGCQPWWKTCALQTQKDADPLPKAITSHRTANVFLLWSFTLTTLPGYTSAPAPARKSALGRRASPPDAAWLERKPRPAIPTIPVRLKGTAGNCCRTRPMGIMYLREKYLHTFCNAFQDLSSMISTIFQWFNYVFDILSTQDITSGLLNTV